MKRFFEFIYFKIFKVGVQEFVDGLYEKLNIIIIKVLVKGGNLLLVSFNDFGIKIVLNFLGKYVILVFLSDFNNKYFFELFCSDILKDINFDEQYFFLILGLIEVDVNQLYYDIELMVIFDYIVFGDIVRELIEKEIIKLFSDVNIFV